jgi:antitoxin MazE
MATRKLILEISESLFEQLEQLSELTEESIESLAIQILASRLPHRIEKERRLNELLEQITPDQLHGEIGFGEPVGREIW